MSENDVYLIWSHEHAAWWADPRGYSPTINGAGRFTRAMTVEHCAHAIAGTAERLERLPDLPIRLADLNAVVGLFAVTYPGFSAEGSSWL